jgi:hypothetical protein
MATAGGEKPAKVSTDNLLAFWTWMKAELRSIPVLPEPADRKGL